MKIFITGATGYVGSAVAAAVARAGHEVHALAHHDRARAALTELGYRPLAGDLQDVEGLARHARESDAVVHAANTGGEDAARVDEEAVRAMVEALEGSDRPFLYTSGIWVLGPTGDAEAVEEPATDPHPISGWRKELESWLVDEADRGVRTVVIRPGIVHGRDGGIPGMMARGELPVIGDGTQRWPVVHVDDLADLYVAALDRAPAGAILHAVSEHVTPLDVARALTGADPARVALDQARESMGLFAEALALDQTVASERTRELVDWEPARPGILEG